jgi:lanthanide-dependent methanol dehydrogenase
MHLEERRRSFEDLALRRLAAATLRDRDRGDAAVHAQRHIATNHVCMDYEPIDKGNQLGRFIAWDATTGRVAWEIPEKWAVWSGALATGGDIVLYGTMDGYAKAIDARSGKVLWQQKLPSRIVGNFMSFQHNGKQYVAVLSGIGGWAALGLAAGLADPNAGLGTVGAFSELAKYTNLGGTLTVFELDGDVTGGASVAR